jgi:hypothetical protein
MPQPKRPDMRPYFAARIEHHVHGMMARVQARLPRDVRRVHGDVTDAVIRVEMNDGTEWKWTGGRYATRKVSGTYAPLMPKPEVS